MKRKIVSVNNKQFGLEEERVACRIYNNVVSKHLYLGEEIALDWPDSY